MKTLDHEKTHLGEICFVGAGLGGGFANTSELKPMKYDEAMARDPIGWGKAVDKEHTKMVDDEVFKAVKIKDLPADAKVLTTAWAMKQKANGAKRARLVARGFQQEDEAHCDLDDIAAPVVNDVTVKIAFAMMLLAAWMNQLVDAKGAFLHGNFENGKEVLYANVPEGMERFYPKNIVLLLLRTIYGLKQVAKQYWIEVLKCFENMGYKRSKADPCLYFKWIEEK